MTDKTTIRLNDEDRQMLTDLARADNRTNSMMIRTLIRQAHERLPDAAEESP